MGNRITGAELEIMTLLWESERLYAFSELLEYFNSIENKKWSKQTLNTYLLRLKKRGFLLQEKRKNGSLYGCALTSITVIN